MADPVRTHYGPHPAQFIDSHPPAPGHGRASAAVGRAGTVLLIHGGYWRNRYGLDLMIPLARHLAGSGWTVHNLEYRRIGDVDDPAEVWPAMAHDIRAATVTALTNPIGPTPPTDATYPTDSTSADEGGEAPRPVVVVGHSAGGHLALWLATQDLPGVGSVDAVVALAPLSDLAEAERRNLSDGAARALLDGGPDDRPDRYRDASPIGHLPLPVPRLVIHGTADDAVPIELSDDYAARARAAGDALTYLRPEGVDHFHVIDPDHDCWRPIDRWLDTLVPAGTGAPTEIGPDPDPDPDPD